MWYSVSIFAVGERDQSRAEEPIWEEQIFLVSAQSEHEARSKAESLAQRDECRYTVVDGSNIRWRFSRISKVYEVLDAEIHDGVEVFSRFLKDSEVKSMLKPIE